MRSLAGSTHMNERSVEIVIIITRFEFLSRFFGSILTDLKPTRNTILLFMIL